MGSIEHISLYGGEHAIAGWQRLLDQEKTPYVYKGAELKHFSEVNIFVGCDTSSVDFPSDKVAITEPEPCPGIEDNTVPIQTFLDGNETVRTHGFAKLENPKRHRTLGTFKETELFTEQTFPIVIKRGKTYRFQTNLSTQLILPGFGFRPIPELSSEDSQVQLYAALTDKEKISRFLRRILVEGFHSIRRPYIHFWYYPTSRPTIMLFRQDVDYVDGQGVAALVRTTKRYGVRGTYFINMSGEEEVEDEIGHLQLDHPITVDRKDLLLPLLEDGNEFANHGYWHWVFDDVKQNVRNIRQCSQYLMQTFGVRDTGFAAPGGTWNYELVRAIDRSGILYSSNITLDMGGFPYHPVYDGRRAKALEIPCNPISDVAFDPHLQPEDLQRLQVYYLSYIDQQIATYEPITLLGHPHLSGRSADTFYPPIFEKIAKEDVPVMTYHDFANWWLQREASSLMVQVDGRHVKLVADGNCSLVEII
ncbi:MAG: polysaccharide deacetylase family protein [Patescibacteria group bacterium]